MRLIDKLPVIGVLLLFSTTVYGQDQGHLLRSLDKIGEVTVEISSETAHYKPMFGTGDEDSKMVTGVERFGYLSIDSQGNSQLVNYGREELIYYVLEGTGILHYENQEVPVSKDDYFYVPVETEHGFSNPRESPLNVIVMGFKIPRETEISPTSNLEIASVNNVSHVVLDGHGPTVTYQLLLGTTESERDRLASAYQVTSLFIMDFKPGGTNNPHRHRNAEEIYFMLQGNGEMVAGETMEGEPKRYAAKYGDAFFYSRNELVGFYSGIGEAVEHARILAVRTVSLRD